MLLIALYALHAVKQPYIQMLQSSIQSIDLLWCCACCTTRSHSHLLVPTLDCRASKRRFCSLPGGLTAATRRDVYLTILSVCKECRASSNARIFAIQSRSDHQVSETLSMPSRFCKKAIVLSNVSCCLDILECRYAAQKNVLPSLIALLLHTKVHGCAVHYARQLTTVA